MSYYLAFAALYFGVILLIAKLIAFSRLRESEEFELEQEDKSKRCGAEK